MTLVRPKGLDPLAVLAMRIVRVVVDLHTPPTAGVSLSLPWWENKIVSLSLVGLVCGPSHLRTRDKNLF